MAFFRIFAAVLFITSFASCGTSKAVKGEKPLKTAESTVKDPEGNKYVVKIMADGKQWMTTNFRMTTPNSYCYADAVHNCEQFGRLYVWDTANNVCSYLGAGWHLPTNDEWQALSRAYASSNDDSVMVRKSAYQALFVNSAAEFNAVLGGGRELDGQFGRIDAHGFYWTSTENDSANACFANFAKGSQALYIQPGGEKARAFAVRCVRDLSKK